MIPQTFIQDLLNRVDIVDVVGRHVQLKKGGANYMGLCPFHNEKSPSFTVSPTKQFYHCFGCGAHGTAISFLMEYAGLGFVEAVKDLSQSVGMIVPEDDNKISPQKKAENQAKSLALTDVMKRANDYYRFKLRSAPEAIAYLKGRGVTGEIAAKFGIGYAPDEWTALKEAFPKYDIPELVEAGLVIEKDEAGAANKRYDRFRHRVMFPIRNTKGMVIGFGGRVMDGGEPKYLNSPETPLFQKGSELYGLFEARQAIREAGYVLVTEGYMDVVALSQWGFPQAVATLGTACTPIHVQKLLRQTDQVIFSFDGDGAGRKAAKRALEACLSHVSDSKTIKFLFLPAEHDPDSFIRAFGTEKFQEQVDNALPLSQFLLNVVSNGQDLKTAEGRAHTQFEAKPLLQAMPASSLRLQITRSLAQMTQSGSDEIEHLFALEKPVQRARAPRPKAKRAAPVGLGRQIARLLMAHPTLVMELTPTDLTTIQYIAKDRAEALMRLIEVGQSLGEQVNFSVLAECLKTESNAFDTLVEEVAKEPESERETVQLELKGALQQVYSRMIEEEMAELAATGLKEDEQKERYRVLTRQIQQLKNGTVA